MSKESYYCENCKLPLSIDASLTTLSKAQVHLLTSGKYGYGRNKSDELIELGNEPYIPQERLELLEKVSKKTNSKWSFQDSGADSFVILPQFEGFEIDENEDHNKDDGSDKVLSNRLKSLSTIFNILSSKSDIDYPVCKECSQLLLTNMKTQYDKTAHERDVYVQFLQKLENRQVPVMSKSEESIKEIDKLQNQETELLEELKQLENENDDLDNEIQKLEKEIEEIDLQEQNLLKLENTKELEILEFKKERDSIKAEYQFNLRQLEKLRKTNVYNDTFNISHDGPFGTINGLRLGSLDSIKVPWQEINAALGQVVLLLATVTSRLNIKLNGYRLKPMGSTSKIEKFETDLSNISNPKTTTLEVYSNGEYKIERLFNHSKLDSAMVALLEILSQIATKLKEYDSSIDLPYKMNNDKIGDASIKLNSKTSDEEWTGACKFLLTNVKWILAYSSAHIPSR